MKIHFGIKGRYLIQKYKDGVLVQTVGPFDNLITNTGLDDIFLVPGAGINNRGILSGAYLGTGTTPPAITDTKLTTFAYGYVDSTYISATYSYVSTSPVHYTASFVWTIPAGIAGTYSEIGVGNGGSTGTTEPTGAYTFSHALITDSVGNPTTISVLATEQLVVTYTLDLYPTVTDTSFSMLINGTTYTGYYRPSNIASSPPYAFGVSGYNSNNGGGQPSLFLYSGDVGPTTGIPSGTSITADTVTWQSYTSGNYYVGFSAQWNASTPLVNSWNSILINSTLGDWQYSFATNPISITAGYSFSLQGTIGWARM